MGEFIANAMNSPMQLLFRR